MLAVDADLMLESGGLRVRIAGSGNVLTCRVDGGAANPFTTLQLGRRILPVLRCAVPVLLATGVRLEVMAGRVRLARVGSGVKQNGLAWLLRLPCARIGN